MIRSIGALALFAFLSVSAAAQATDSLLIKLRASQSGGGYGTRVRVQDLNAIHQVTEMEPLFPANVDRSPAFRRLGLDRIYRLTFAQCGDSEWLCGEYRKSAEVEVVEADLAIQIERVANDPLSSSQWALDRIAMEEGWELTTNADLVVGVIDTGIDLDHADLLSNLWVNAGEIPGNLIDDDNNGYVDDVHGYDFLNGDANPDDDHGHGTHVAGTIGARGNNSTLISGVCWEAKVAALKVLGANGSGSLSAVAEAVVYAADNGFAVTNMSLGTSSNSTLLKDAVTYAAGEDVLQVAAAGNEGTSTRQYPAGYQRVIAVINTDFADQRNSSSTFGTWCDVAAPGTSILSLFPGGGLATMTGTSMASPHVAGLAALVRARHPDLTWKQVRQVIRNSVDDLGAPGFDEDFGFGRIHAGRALAMAGSLRRDQAQVGPGEIVTLALDVPGGAGHSYLLLPSLSGMEPGFGLSGLDAGDFRNIPVNFDWLTNFALTHPTAGLFVEFFATLDGNGQADASFLVPGRALANETLNLAFVTIDPANLGSFEFVSNPISVELTE